MRLDGRNGDHGWYVWDCELVKEIPFVVWIDDSISEYGVYSDKTSLDITTRKVRKIDIIIPSKTVFINPIGDNEIDNISLLTGKELEKV
jgi:hypothetical protein